MCYSSWEPLVCLTSQARPPRLPVAFRQERRENQPTRYACPRPLRPYRTTRTSTSAPEEDDRYAMGRLSPQLQCIPSPQAQCLPPDLLLASGIATERSSCRVCGGGGGAIAAAPQRYIPFDQPSQCGLSTLGISKYDDRSQTSPLLLLHPWGIGCPALSLTGIGYHHYRNAATSHYWKEDRAKPAM